MKKRWIMIAAGALIVGAAAWFALGSTKGSGAAAAATKKSYDYTQAKKGSIEKSISTSGTLQPESTVKVVSQMSGKAEAIYADYNDQVRKGQVLVSLNTDMLKLQELQSAAALQKAQANHELQAANYAAKEALGAKGLISDYDLATAKTSLAAAAADLASAKASWQVVETELNQYALVKSPIDGIVLDKNVEVGQTVVDSSSSGSSALFTLAGDLSSMEIKATVDELDITSVKVGQEVRFTVESQPGVEFAGRVKEILLTPVTSNNVVSYYVVVDAPNKGGKLLPGMTATMDFIQERKEGALLVPNAALRYTPSSLSAEETRKLMYLARLPADERAAAAARFDEEAKAAASGGSPATSSRNSTGLTSLVMGGSGPGAGGPPGGFAGGPGGPGDPGSSSRSSSASKGGASGSASGTASATAESQDTARKALWYLDAEGKLACAMVAVGISDGVNTEISSDEDLSSIKFILREKAE